jgi:hypothetical protein
MSDKYYIKKKEVKHFSILLVAILRKAPQVGYTPKDVWWESQYVVSQSIVWQCVVSKMGQAQ